jgi:arylsulfatase A-like enzyme
LTMVDVHLGRVFDMLEQHDLWKTTCVIITTDHGHYLGEHGFVGKPAAPLYHTLCHVPLFIWHPEGVHNGTRVQAISQTVDLYATVLELLGLGPGCTEVTHSRSLVPLLEGQSKVHRDVAIYGYCGERVGITDSEWTLLRDHDVSQAETYWYSAHTDQLYSRSFPMRHQRPSLPKGLQTGNFIPGVSQPVWRMKAAERALELPRPDLLFHNPTDPEQQHSVVDAHPRKVAELEDQLRQQLRGLDVPLEQAQRLRL